MCACVCVLHSVVASFVGRTAGLDPDPSVEAVLPAMRKPSTKCIYKNMYVPVACSNIYGYRQQLPALTTVLQCITI